MSDDASSSDRDKPIGIRRIIFATFFSGFAKNGEGLRFWELLSIIGFTMCLVGIAVYALAEGSFATTFSVLALVGAAAWLSGGVLGFLFGVPRLRASVSPGSAQQNSNAFVPNTNLEQISDWLTKIIVGATLVQIGPLAQDLNNLAIAIGDQLGTKGAAAASGAVLVVNFSAGFMWGYLWCSLRIFREMSALSDREQEVTKRESAQSALEKG